MYLVALVLVALSLLAWAFLTLIKGGVKARLCQILKIYEAEIAAAAADPFAFKAFYIGNAGIYYYPYLSNPLVRLAMQLWIVLGLLDIIIFAYAAYRYGISLLTILALGALALKFFTDTERFYSFSNTPDVLEHWTRVRYQKERRAMLKNMTGAGPLYDQPLSRKEFMEYHRLGNKLTYSYLVGSKTIMEK